MKNFNRALSLFLSAVLLFQGTSSFAQSSDYGKLEKIQEIYINANRDTTAREILLSAGVQNPSELVNQLLSDGSFTQNQLKQIAEMIVQAEKDGVEIQNLTKEQIQSRLPKVQVAGAILLLPLVPIAIVFLGYMYDRALKAFDHEESHHHEMQALQRRELEAEVRAKEAEARAAEAEAKLKEYQSQH